jgi:large subunit ribosomal protein L15
LASDKGLSSIGFDELLAARLISKKSLVKVLATGNLTSKLTVSAHAFSAAAKEAIEAQGGSVVIIEK